MKIIHLEQQTQAWLDYRKNKIGASLAPIIMRANKYYSRKSLWKEMVGAKPPKESNFNMREGVRKEPFAREYFEKEMGFKVPPIVIEHETYPFIMCSLDGLSECLKIAVEIKCVGEKTHAIAKEGKIPEIYFPQLQHQMMCTGLEEVFYMSYQDDYNVVILKCARDQVYIDLMLSEEIKFWEAIQDFREVD